MLRIHLDPGRHGSAGFTSVTRLAAGAVFSLLVVLGVSMAAQIFFDGRIMPGVVVGDQPVGGQSLPAARRDIAKMMRSFAVQVKIDGKSYSASAEQLGVTYDAGGTADAAYATGRQSWYWPDRHAIVPLRYQLDSSQLDTFVNGLEHDVSHPPTDAGIKISQGNVSVTPAISGMSIDKSALVKLIVQAIAYPSRMAIQPQVHVMPADLQVADLTPAVAQAQKIISTPIQLSFENRTFSPSSTIVGQWITFSKQQDGLAYKLVPSVNNVAIGNYVASVARQINAAPLSQEVFVANNTTKTIRNGSDGVTVDQATVQATLADAVAQASPLDYSIPTETVAYSTQSSNLTPLNYLQYIEVNLTTQHLYAWQNGQVIYDSPITSGATGAGFATVTGMFHIYYKATNTHLIGYQYGPEYDYDVAVQYWMPFYQGYGLHDASWRHGNFGGQDYYYGGSHGCVNLPLATAAFLYGWAPVGTPVWVHN